MREVHKWSVDVLVGNGLASEEEVARAIHDVTRTALVGGQIVSILTNWDSDAPGRPVVTITGIGRESLAYVTQAIGEAPDAQEETLTEAT